MKPNAEENNNQLIEPENQEQEEPFNPKQNRKQTEIEPTKTQPQKEKIEDPIEP